MTDERARELLALLKEYMHDYKDDDVSGDTTLAEVVDDLEGTT